MKNLFQFQVVLFLLVFNSSINARSVGSYDIRSKDEKQLLYSRDFAEFIYQAGKNSIDFYNELKRNNCWNRAFANNLMACKTKEEVQKLCQNTNVSYEIVLNTNTYPNAYYVNFLYGNPGFFEMDAVQQGKEYNNVISKICLDSVYRGI